MDTNVIAGLLAKATLAYDEQDKERFLGCFTQDVIVRVHMPDGAVMALQGRENLAARSSGLHAEINLLRHMVMTPTIEVTGDESATAVYQQLYVMVGPDPKIAGAGKYIDKIKLVDGEWLIAERDNFFLSPPPTR